MPSPLPQSSQDSTFAQYQPMFTIFIAVRIWAPLGQTVRSGWAGPGPSSVVLLLSLQSGRDFEDILLMLYNKGMRAKTKLLLHLALLHHWPTYSIIYSRAALSKDPLVFAASVLICSLTLNPSHSSSLLKAFQQNHCKCGWLGIDFTSKPQVFLLRASFD